MASRERESRAESACNVKLPQHTAGSIIMAQLPEISVDELACIYSAAILADDDIPVTSEKITTLLNAAGVQAEPIWPTLFARALNGMNVREMITNIGAGMAPAGGATAAGPGGAAAPEPEVKEEKKSAPVEDSDSDDGDMGFGLFD